MTLDKNKCCFILSDKSSGSSALHRAILNHPEAQCIRWTRHNENETLFWNKAAALLEQPQVDVEYSELPFSREQAEHELVEFVANNLPDYQRPPDNREFLFTAWESLSRAFGPVFVDKTPHHLQYASSLRLMDEWDQQSSCESRYIGLVRNPQAVLYSSFRRWNADPKRAQWAWYRAYKNLLDFRDTVGNKILIISYESICQCKDEFDSTFLHLGIEATVDESKSFHSGSLERWRTDSRSWHFELDEEVSKLAQQFGYSEEDLIPKKSRRRIFQW